MKDGFKWDETKGYGATVHMKLFRVNDGAILISILHGCDYDDPWYVFEHGAARGSYMTKEQAIARAESLL